MTYKYLTKPFDKPVVIYWKVIAGPPNFKLEPIMDHDLILDDYDLKIRKMDRDRKFIKFM